MLERIIFSVIILAITAWAFWKAKIMPVPFGMAFTLRQVSDRLLYSLYEDKGLWNKVDRSNDSRLLPGADSVDIPALPLLEVTTAATAKDAAGRKRVIADTSMVNVPIAKSKVSIRREVEAEKMVPALVSGFVESAKRAFRRSFDLAVITEAQTTTDINNWGGVTLSFADIIKLSAKFDENEVPVEDRIVVVPASIKADFYEDDVMKLAIAYTKEFLEGAFVKLDNMMFYVSGKVPQIGGKENIVGIYGPGLSFILANDIFPAERYDEDQMMYIVDYIVRTGKKLLDPKFAIVYKQA